MKTKEKKQVKTQDSIVTAVITAASLIAFIGGYFLSSGLTNKNVYVTNDNKDEEVVSATTGLSKEMAFNEDNIYQKNLNVEYKITFPAYYLDDQTYYKVDYGTTNKELVLTKFTNLEIVKKYTLEFDLKIVDIAILKDTNKDAVLYLLEDGSVEYTFMDDVVSNDFLRTSGRINEALNIVKFVEGTACDKILNECENVVYAQGIDGTLYNVNELI